MRALPQAPPRAAPCDRQRLRSARPKPRAFLGRDTVADALTDRGADPLLRSHLWAYPAGIDWFVNLADTAPPHSVRATRRAWTTWIWASVRQRDHGGKRQVTRWRCSSGWRTDPVSRDGSSPWPTACRRAAESAGFVEVLRRYGAGIGRHLFSAVAEAMLLAAWMAYDSGRHGPGTALLREALHTALNGKDQLLAGSVLSAMSHQAS